MKLPIIARRALTCAEDPERKFLVRIAKPLRARRSGDYACHYEITGPTIGVKRVVYGLDAVQALQCALVVIAGDLERIEQVQSIHLQFGGGGHGFPGATGPDSTGMDPTGKRT
jgi:hypothetical protein